MNPGGMWGEGKEGQCVPSPEEGNRDALRGEEGGEKKKGGGGAPFHRLKWLFLAGKRSFRAKKKGNVIIHNLGGGGRLNFFGVSDIKKLVQSPFMSVHHASERRKEERRGTHLLAEKGNFNSNWSKRKGANPNQSEEEKGRKGGVNLYLDHRENPFPSFSRGGNATRVAKEKGEGGKGFSIFKVGGDNAIALEGGGKKAREKKGKRKKKGCYHLAPEGGGSSEFRYQKKNERSPP